MNIEKFNRAVAYIEAIPEHLFNLSTIAQKLDIGTDCGTCGCAAGWLTTEPSFKADGLGLWYNLNWHSVGLTYAGTNHVSSDYAAPMARVLGCSVDLAGKLFEPTCKDEKVFRKIGTDKQVWLARAEEFRITGTIDNSEYQEDFED